LSVIPTDAIKLVNRPIYMHILCIYVYIYCLVVLLQSYLLTYILLFYRYLCQIGSTIFRDIHKSSYDEIKGDINMG
jgi:hypothetical protein